MVFFSIDAKAIKHRIIALISFMLLIWLATDIEAKKTTATAPQPNAQIGLTDEEKAFIAAHSHIRVHNETAWAPFNYFEGGEAKGYSIDYMNLLASKVGLSVEYISGPTWGEFLTKIKNKELDVMLNIINTEDRRKYLNFTNSYLEPFTAIYGREDAPNTITSLKDIKGSTIALPKGFYTEELINRHYPEIKLYTTKNMQGAVEAVRDGKADFAIGEDAVIQYLISAHNIEHVRAIATIEDARFANKLNIGVRDDWPLLRDILQKAINNVTDNEILRLRNRWFGGAVNTLELTKEEKAFLKGHPTIRVHNEMDWPPFNFNEDGQPKGYSIDYMNLVADKLGLNVEYVSGPSWNQFLNMIDNKEIDVMLNIKDIESRRPYILFTEPYFNSLSGIFTKPNQQSSAIEDLIGKRVAVVEGFYYQEVLSENYPDIEQYLTSSVAKSMEAVVLNKADAVLADFNVANFLIQQQGIFSIQATGQLKDERFASPLSLGVRKDWPTLASILQKAIDSMTEEDLAFIKSKWLKYEATEKRSTIGLNLNERHYLDTLSTVRVCYRPDWQPIEFFDDQRYAASGVSIDTLNLLNERIKNGLRFEFVASNTTQESIAKFRKGECDLMPSLSKSEGLESDAIFTAPYKRFKAAIITRDDSPFINTLDELEGQTLAQIRGDTLNTAIRNENEFLSILETDSTVDALEMVSTGKAFATLTILPVASHYMTELGLSNLKIAGYSDIDVALSIAVNKQSQPLFPILNKGLANLTEQEHHDIFRQRVSIKIEPKIDYWLMLQILGAAVLIVAFLVYRQVQITRYNKVLQTLTITDPLTQVYNRAKLDTVLEEQASLFERYKECFCVIFCDIDHFKDVNDTYGHQIGDKFLVAFANQLLLHARKTDVVGRWGGEEFMIICPRTNLEGANKLALKLKDSIANFPFEVIGRRTASFGVAEYDPQKGTYHLVNQVDKALYKSKTSGRNAIYYEKDREFYREK